MRQGSHSFFQIVGAVLRILCIAIPVIAALGALVMIARYEQGRSIIPTDHVPGATQPTGN
ncbi:hypothetical protein Brsp04_03261 [Brucella sp. NBRC 12952]|uniref:Uncharacterized protein n=1 Tax=Brucella pseudogrignonensis TaxID=419475 RepID=A0A7Y3T8K6_9HYPH|nr:MULTISPECIES: hypothetical protein [Brucella]NNV23091.1 hypothetical protein [Brucella pseudogrignonensis]